MLPPLPVEQRDVKGYRFEFTTLTATEARKIHAVLLRSLGPAAQAIANKSQGVDAGKALSDVLSNLSDEDIDKVHEKLSANCRVLLDGKWVPMSQAYELLFAAKPLLMWSWCIEGLKVNFADFLDGGLKEKLEEAQAKMSQ